jgi:hypothetical protein
LAAVDASRENPGVSISSATDYIRLRIRLSA